MMAARTVGPAALMLGPGDARTYARPAIGKANVNKHRLSRCDDQVTRGSNVPLSVRRGWTLSREKTLALVNGTASAAPIATAKTASPIH